ncbi:MAG: transposase zinc-binding domain-containing protein [Deltaproteobacteria bacterium]|nr:transposase zinc-binding domain-containing protein [Deltaproteobacteria bacterium]
MARGVRACGFVLLFCDRCQREHALASSCKGRAICPSCGARRMQETAAHLVDDVLPDVALRQYVLSPPFELRGLLACKREVLAKMVNFFVRAIFEQLNGWARCQGLPEPKCGAVTFIQRFTKTLNISPHLHVLVLDGVFANEEEGPRFVESPAPTNRDLLSLAQSVFKKMEKFLAKSGYLRSESDALEEASLTPVERWYGPPTATDKVWGTCPWRCSHAESPLSRIASSVTFRGSRGGSLDPPRRFPRQAASVPGEHEGSLPSSGRFDSVAFSCSFDSSLSFTRRFKRSRS